MRNVWLNLPTIMPTTAYHQRNYVETYSRFSSAPICDFTSYSWIKHYFQTVGFCTDAHAGPLCKATDITTAQEVRLIGKTRSQ